MMATMGVRRARSAQRILAVASPALKTASLEAMAESFEQARDAVLQQNDLDMARAKK